VKLSEPRHYKKELSAIFDPSIKTAPSRTQRPGRHSRPLRTEPIIDPFSCLLTEPVSSLGFCCESIDCSSHNESPKPPGFGVFNSSSCAPVKSGGTSLYCESDSVSTMPVHFFHSSPTLCQSEKQDQTEPCHLTPSLSSQVHGSIGKAPVAFPGHGSQHPCGPIHLSVGVSPRSWPYTHDLCSNGNLRITS
jgi:hypothetical protein